MIVFYVSLNGMFLMSDVCSVVVMIGVLNMSVLFM